jgi:tetratricopeptide (TPR) repeat protein
MLINFLIQLKDIPNMKLYCSNVLEIDENHIDALCYRGEAKILEEDFEGAVRDFEKAYNVNQQDKRVWTIHFICFHYFFNHNIRHMRDTIEHSVC